MTLSPTAGRALNRSCGASLLLSVALAEAATLTVSGRFCMRVECEPHLVDEGAGAVAAELASVRQVESRELANRAKLKGSTSVPCGRG